MELLYSMRRKPLKCAPPQYERVTDPECIHPICTISTGNIIAFSSPTELGDVEGDTWGGHVYVCDMETPWDSHKVTSTAYPVSALEWDIEGKQLLVATSVGDVSVYGMKEYLLNDWYCLYTATFPGERVVQGIFFHSGRRVLALDKKPDAPVTERVQAIRRPPTLKGFGGSWSPGAVVVTGSGAVCAVTPPAPAPAPSSSDTPPRAHTATDSLRPQRTHVTRAALAHKNGGVLVAAVCVSSASGWCVRCALVTVSVSGACPTAPAAHLHLQPLPVPTVTPAPHLHDPAPASIAWSLYEEPDALLVSGASLTMWKLTERSYPIHKLLYKGVAGGAAPGGGTKPADCFNTVVWQQTGSWPSESADPAVHVASSRLPLPGAAHAVLATQRDIHLLSRDSQHYLCSRPVVTGDAGGDASPPKKAKYGAAPAATGGSVCCVSVSWLGGVAAVIDTRAQVHVYRLPQTWSAGAAPSPVSVSQCVSLLEYSYVSGVDPLDVLLTLKHNRVATVYDRLTESFQRQPAPFQQYYFHACLKLRAALCRLSAPLASSASQLASLQSAHALWACVTAALRGEERSDAALLADEFAPDHDKALLSLEGRTEPVLESPALQALRRPLQRAADLALTTLLTLPHTHHQTHGYELQSDSASLTLLRKLLAVSRGVCGDPALGRMLARLQAPAANKADLMEECMSLSVSARSRLWESLPRCGVSAPHQKPPPYYLEYGVSPDALRVHVEPPTLAHLDTTPAHNMDAIRYMYLGGRTVPSCRSCSRCGARALAHAQPARSPAQRAHDARFYTQCRCGGRWTLCSNV